MKKTDNAVNILTAMTYNKVGKAWVVKNLSKPIPLERIIELIKLADKENENCSIDDFLYRKECIRHDLNALYKEIGGFEVTAIGDDDFPQYRGNVKNSEKPVVLFYKGDLSLLDKGNSNVAVIGLLNPNGKIEENERKVVAELVNRNITIVSGLANGCDYIAHHETLMNGGKTVAILPSPLNNILPTSNSPLARDIWENGGLVITEYYKGINSPKMLSGRYIERDRLQALFSDCVVLSASYDENKLGNDSGSRHAMGKAKEYGLARAVIYSELMDIDNPMFDLTRRVISEDKSVIIVNNENISDAVDRIVKRTNKASEQILFS